MFIKNQRFLRSFTDTTNPSSIANDKLYVQISYIHSPSRPNFVYTFSLASLQKNRRKMHASVFTVCMCAQSSYAILFCLDVYLLVSL